MYNHGSIVIGMSTVTVWDVGCRFLSSDASLGPASPQATPSMSLAGATKLGEKHVEILTFEKNMHTYIYIYIFMLYHTAIIEYN